MTAQATAAAHGFVEKLAEDLNDRDLELPSFPDAVARIQMALQRDDNDINDIVTIISSDPALAARVLQLANSAAVRCTETEIVDIRKAVIHMGYKLVQSSAIAFALRQMQRNEGFSDAARTEIEQIWKESVEVASLSYALASNYAKLNPDEALLTGLLSVLGRLYIFMRSEETGDISNEEIQGIIHDWHPTIAKAIAETWGMSEELANALAAQLEYEREMRGPVCQADVLISAKLIARSRAVGAEMPSARQYPPLRRLVGDVEGPVDISAHDDEIYAIAKALGA